MGLLPEFSMKDIKVGSGSIIGKSNIEELLNHINSLYDLNEKSWVELTYDYEGAIASLVERLEARFINLHPTIHQLFFKLESMEKGEDKDFLLKPLLMEFDDIAREARFFFAHYNMMGCSLDIKHTLKTFETKRMNYEGKTECEKELKYLYHLSL